MTRPDRRLAWSIFALCLASYAYFYSGGGWNENSRFDLVRAIVDDHSLTIDRYHENTGDKAHFRGHYYSDKAPGASFLAVPAYGVVRLLRPLFRTDHDFMVLAAWLVTCLTVSVAGAATAALVYRGGRELGATPGGALIASIGYGLGTPAFPLSTMLFGHQLAALILLSAFLFAWESDEKREKRTMLVVLLCASAAIVEYPTLPVAFGIALYHIGPRLSRRTWTALGAAAVPAFALALYLAMAFGSPLRVGYDLLSDPGSRAEMHAHGLFGVSYPKPEVLLSLLLNPSRGLLLYSPIVLLAIPGFAEGLLAREGEATAEHERRHGAVLVALGVVVYFLLFVSSYEWWQGGASFGSRHLVPMLPFLALPMAVGASRWPRFSLALLLPSMFVMIVVTSVQPKPSEWLQNPFWSTLLPAFMEGSLAITKSCPVFGNPAHPEHHPFLSGAGYDAFNVGMVLGGRGLRSLIPLGALWVTSAWALARELRGATLPAPAEAGKGEPGSDR